MPKDVEDQIARRVLGLGLFPEQDDVFNVEAHETHDDSAILQGNFANAMLCDQRVLVNQDLHDVIEDGDAGFSSTLRKDRQLSLWECHIRDECAARHMAPSDTLSWQHYGCVRRRCSCTTGRMLQGRNGNGNRR